ncbi:MAG: hypothetical protein ACFFBW_10240 [Promethearchaeota archaeon]
MIGTSPFIGAGQFGLRAQEFREKFLFHPEKMLEIMEAAYQAGARGMEVITAGEISKAAMIMKETYNDFIITGSTFPGPDPMIEELMNLDSKIIFIHAMVSDRKNQNLFELIDDIVSRGVIPGIAVHNTISTLKFSFEHTIVKTFLIPFNAKGIFMGDKQKLEDIINNRKDCYFIGMKTLAAGKIEPQLAYAYIAKNNICSVSIGMVTPEEAKTSTKIALNALKSKM